MEAGAGTAELAVHGVFLYTPGSVVRCNNLWKTACSTEHNPGAHNFRFDPLYCDRWPGDVAIARESPCAPENALDGCGRIGALDVACELSMLVSACCFPSGACVVLTEEDCDDAGGAWQGPSVSCDPYPCVVTEVEATTWGRIKSMYRGNP